MNHPFDEPRERICPSVILGERVPLSRGELARTGSPSASTECQERFEDLRAQFQEREVTEWALDAVHTVTMGIAGFTSERLDECNPRRLLGLLTYCYVVGIYDSDRIEWAAEHDETARHLCARAIPDSQGIRLFRKAYRPLVEQCLAHVLNRAASRPTRDELGRSARSRSLFGSSQFDALACARRKVELAILMDNALSD